MGKTKLIIASMTTAIALSGCDPKSAESIERSTAGEEMAVSSEDKRPSPLMVKEGQINGKNVTIHYGAPSVKGREIWGDLVPYNVVWRTGANEATYIETEEDLLIAGKTLAPGKYSIFTIPKENQSWTVIFNSEWDLEHGHFQYDEKNDVLRFDAKPQFVGESAEVLSLDLVDSGIQLAWEKVTLLIEIE